jgi:ABC-2 type transport system ATP-binding protein
MGRRYETVGSFSRDTQQGTRRGMQHKAAVSTALMTGPLILLLDEPTCGLDVEAARTFKGWIEAAKSHAPSVHHHRTITRRD